MDGFVGAATVKEAGVLTGKLERWMEKEVKGEES
jgi:hypothetical protein